MRLWLILDIALIAVSVYFVYRSWSVFHAAEGTFWQRAWKAVESSATILWGYIVFSAGQLLDWALQASVYLQQPEIEAYIRQSFSVEGAAKVLSIVGAVIFLARIRSLWLSVRSTSG